MAEHALDFVLATWLYVIAALLIAIPCVLVVGALLDLRETWKREQENNNDRT